MPVRITAREVRFSAKTSCDSLMAIDDVSVFSSLARFPILDRLSQVRLSGH
jgi:hypothetical protein